MTTLVTKALIGCFSAGSGLGAPLFSLLRGILQHRRAAAAAACLLEPGLWARAGTDTDGSMWVVGFTVLWLPRRLSGRCKITWKRSEAPNIAKRAAAPRPYPVWIYFKVSVHEMHGMEIKRRADVTLYEAVCWEYSTQQFWSSPKYARRHNVNATTR